MNTRHEHDTHSHTPSPLRAPSRGVLILTPEESPLSSEFFLLFAFLVVEALQPNRWEGSVQ